MATLPLDDISKLLSAGLGILGTWLTLRNFYSARRKELEAKHQEVLDRYAGSQQKAYAAERDFNHLRNNQEQLKHGVELIDDELGEVKEKLGKLEGMVQALLMRDSPGDRR